MVAAAIVGTGLAAATATVASGAMASDATKSATNASIAEQQSALGQQAQLSAPYRALGEAAIPKYEQLLGLTPGSNPNTIKAALESMPGYQFSLEEGQKGIMNAASLTGGVSGNTLADLDKFNTGLADSTFQTQLGDVAGAVGSGQAAAAGQAQNVGQAAGNISSALINQGNTTAGIDANVVAGLSKTLGNASDQYLTYQTMQALNNQGGGAGIPQATGIAPAATDISV